MGGGLAPEIVLALSQAESALGRLAGATSVIPEAPLFTASFVVREAVASCGLDGPAVSVRDVFLAAHGDAAADDEAIRTVAQYRAALEEGGQRLEHAALTPRLTEDPHADEWGGAGEPPLITTGRMIAGFAAPRPDGPDGQDDGRRGRLLAVAHLRQHAGLSGPLLCLSPYFVSRRSDYLAHLDAARTGETQGWLRFFLTAVADQATAALAQVRQLIAARERYRSELNGVRSRVGEVIDLMFASPVLTTTAVSDPLKVSVQAALNYIRELESRGWVQELPSRGRGGRTYWAADEIIELVGDGAVR